LINITPDSSSIAKGESLKDTAKTLEAMQASIIVIRHPEAGIPHILAKTTQLSVINAGDGCHEHPTQALLDIFTIKERFKTLKGLRILIVGDILHSRVARSNILGMTKLGAEVLLCGPPNLIPPYIDKLKNVSFGYNLQEMIKHVDVVMMLRIQFERQTRAFIPSIKEYNRLFCLNQEKLKYTNKNILIMHPGPVNRNIEISDDIVDSKYSLIHEQVTNGIAVRMAVLYLLAKR
jgi:aspartate carbamoyltransferase catalytic subunit